MPALFHARGVRRHAGMENADTPTRPGSSTVQEFKRYTVPQPKRTDPSFTSPDAV